MCVAGFRIPGCSCDQEGAYQLKGALAAEETVQLQVCSLSECQYPTSLLHTCRAASENSGRTLKVGFGKV